MVNLLDLIKIKDSPLSESEIKELADLMYGGSLIKMLYEYRNRLQKAIIKEDRHQILLFRREINKLRAILKANKKDN